MSAADATVARVNAILHDVLGCDRDDLKPAAVLCDAPIYADWFDCVQIAAELETSLDLNRQLDHESWETVADIHSDVVMALGMGDAA